MRRAVPAQVIRFAAAIAVALAAAMAMAQTPEPQSAQPQAVTAGRVDLASVAMGGRVESATSQIAWEEWSPVNLITANAPPQWGWSADRARLPQELVFSFFTHQAGVIDTVVINPLPKPTEGGAAKEVEIWTSLESATDGFTQVASATLEPVDAEQAITFAPVEAKFVKLRILSAQPQFINNEPNAWPARLRRVRILEGSQPGYEPLLSRNEDLAALVAGVIPAPPADAAGPPIPADGPACVLPTEAPRKPNFAESRRVLVVSADTKYYTPSEWKPNRGKNLNNKNDYSLVERVEFTGVAPRSATPALLLPQMGFDTVVFSMVCEFDEIVSQEFQQSLLPWVAAGHKLILQDADVCGAATGRRRFPTYSFLPYFFATVNPGARGAKGVAHLLESSSLISNDRESPSFVNLEAWVQETDGNGQEIGDSNLIVEWDPHWCGAVFARNDTQKNGFLLAYAKYGRGLIIYDGADYDQVNSPDYEKYLLNILAQPFDPDNLPCSQPLGDFVLTTDTGLKTQHMTAGSSYTYPLTVYANNAYTGSVTIHASVSPTDPTVSVTVEPATVELGELATASVTVTTTAATPATSHIVALRGVDTAGKSNVLCLNLPERRSGSVQVLSGLRQDRKPPRNIEIILDASGSMKAMLGGKTRWAVAQDVLKEVVAKLPAEFSVGLRAYGHTLSSKDPNTCTDTALVLPVVPLNADQLLALAKGLAPRGETPLVYSILQTPADLQAVGGGTVILITDGEESCKGDFAAAEETLKASGLNLLLNIVGFTLDNAPAEAQLTRLAESTGGNYYGAASGEELARALLLAAVDRLPYRILDAAGEEVAQGEAGVGRAHELPAGDYTVVITAADLELRTPVTIEIAKDSVLTAAIKGSQLVVVEGASAPEPTSSAPAAGAAAGPAESPPPETKVGAKPVDTPQTPPTVTASPADAPPAETPVMVDAKTTPAVQASAAVEPADTPPPGEASPSAAAETAAASVKLEDLGALVDLIVADAGDLPRVEFDPAVLAEALDRDPQKLFEWVRDHTWWAPYRGLLRGAKGVMLDRIGSSLDRAVLLGDLLRRAGHTVRLAHTQLPEDRARELLAKVRPIPDQRRSPPAPKPISAERQRAIEAVLPKDEKSLQEQIADSRRRTDEAKALVRSQADELYTAVKGNATGDGTADQRTIAALQDHWWVERNENGTWVAMDVLLPSARSGNTMGAASQTSEWKMDLEFPSIPESNWHSVQLRVVVERYEGGTTSESTVLETVLRPAEVLDRPILFTHMPQPWPERLSDSRTDPSALRNAAASVKEWLPFLQIGDELVAQSGFTESGDVIADPLNPKRAVAETGGGGLMSGFDDALGGGEATPSFVTAEWLDYEIRVPGEPAQRLRRPIFDLLGPAQRSATASDFDASTNDRLDERYEALLSTTDIFLQPCDISEEFLAHLMTRSIVANQAAIRDLTRETDAVKVIDLASAILDRIDTWGPLPSLAFWRSELGGQAGAWYIDRPNVLNYRIGQSFANADRVSIREQTDIAANAIGVRRVAGMNSFEVRLRQGVADTVAEMLALGSDPGKSENTASIFARAGAGADRKRIGPGDTGTVQALGWPQDAAARLAGDIEAGFIAVALLQPVSINERQRFGWWRVAPETGETIGVMDTGFHADEEYLEVLQMMQRLENFLSNSSKTIERLRKLKTLTPDQSTMIRAADAAVKALAAFASSRQPF